VITSTFLQCSFFARYLDGHIWNQIHRAAHYSSHSLGSLRRDRRSRVQITHRLMCWNDVWQFFNFINYCIRTKTGASVVGKVGTVFHCNLDGNTDKINADGKTASIATDPADIKDAVQISNWQDFSKEGTSFPSDSLTSSTSFLNRLAATNTDHNNIGNVSQSHLPSGFRGVQTGIGSWFQTNSPVDSTNGTSYFGKPYNDS